jgi:cellulose synthase/poly-beta-1,6-N-acetylglucosamine synthase-like glycosyltransferase
MWVPELILLLYFGYVVSYALIFSIAGLFYKTPFGNPSAVFQDFCVLLPAYREDAVILEAAKKAIEQEYPAAHYTVVVIADSLQSETLVALRKLPIEVMEVHFDNSTKVKSLNEAFSRLPESFGFAVILDGDNVMAPDFLTKMNSIVSPEIRAVQGQRKPKNRNNSLALLDGVSEAINNHIYRQGSVSLGLSSAISGSGVIFDYAILKKKLTRMDSIGGFDRELEVLLQLEDGIKVQYHKGAVVYDEKVSQTKAFQNQRKRWISSQYLYLRKYFATGISAFFRGDFTFFNTAVLRNIQLPRLINIGLLTVLTFLFIIIRHYLYFDYRWWVVLFAVNTFAILVAIPREFFTWKLFAAVAGLPVIFFRMLVLLFKLKGANKKFIHTAHSVTNTNTNQ